MSATARIEPPAACTAEEIGEFARLVLLGFPRAEDLDRRIGSAKQLAFAYAADGTLAAVAALKVPGERHRDSIFHKAESPVSAADYELDLGWVFVLPEHRGRRIAEDLGRRLLARAPGAAVFATTRTDNGPMIGILETLGFARIGRPYPRRDEMLVLFVRPAAESRTAAGETTTADPEERSREP